MTRATARVQARNAEAEARWLRERCGPDLQELVRARGGRDRITAEARAAYDPELALWRLRTAVGDFHQASPPAARGGVSVSEASNLIQGKHL
jgi:hypothetical protein